MAPRVGAICYVIEVSCSKRLNHACSDCDALWGGPEGLGIRLEKFSFLDSGHREVIVRRRVSRAFLGVLRGLGVYFLFLRSLCLDI